MLFRSLEVEAVALIGDNLTLSLSAAYIDAEIKEFLGADCYPGQTAEKGCSPDETQDIRGGELPNAPDLKFNLMADYLIELPDMPFDASVNASFTWQDDTNFALTQNPLTEQDSYGVANLSFTIRERNDSRYEVTAFVRNLTDEHYRAGVSDLRILYGGASALGNIWSRDSQQYYGVRAKLNF